MRADSSSDAGTVFEKGNVNDMQSSVAGSVMRRVGQDAESDASYMVKGNANDMQSEAQSYMMRAESLAESDGYMVRGKSIADDASAAGADMSSNASAMLKVEANNSKQNVFAGISEQQSETSEMIKGKEVDMSIEAQDKILKFNQTIDEGSDFSNKKNPKVLEDSD